MKLNKTDLLLLRTINSRFGASTVSELFGELPAGLFANKRALSARLCEMRGRNLLQSATTESGVNEWELSAIGSAAIAQDMTDVIGVPATEPVQTDSSDILPNITERKLDPIAADLADAIEGAALRFFPETGIPESTPADVADDLVEEANTLRMALPFPRVQDALYVLAVLADFVGDRASMATELDRIADYLREVAV